MKKLLIAILAIMLLAAACGDDVKEAPEAASPVDEADTGAAEPEPDEMADGSGEMDEGDGAPQRIVSLSPSATETLFAIGVGDRVVAVDQFSYFPKEAPVTDLDGWSPNVEAIASYEPDLVLMQTNGDVQASLELLGITVFAADAPLTLSDAYARIEQIGAVTGNIAEAAEVVLEMQTKIKPLIADAPDASGLTYFHEIDNTLYTVTSSTFIGEVYALFGLSNVADPADADGFGYPQLNDEYLIDADPDLVFLADTLCCAQSAEVVAERAGWDQLSAVQNGNVIELNDDVVSRWSTRLVLFIEAIASALAGLTVAS